MRRVTRNSVFALAASGAMAVTFPVGTAFATDGAAAEGSAAGSPGLISGNAVQLPVHVPVHVCGNTVDVAGFLNPAAGNSCAGTDEGGKGGRNGESGAAREGSGAFGGAAASGGGKDSPGVLSGNGVQLPVHLPVNVGGNSVNVVGVGNAAAGNESAHTPGHRPGRPHRPEPETEPSVPSTDAPRPRPHAPRPNAPRPHAAPPRPVTSLAETGTDHTVPALGGATALVLGGAVLFRRFRPGRTDDATR
ncbi:Chaplin-B [Streptomyces sp. enrichment culture]|uniref:chaplin n=1 Tax=Streptomyces sp. enrichment culture TaxID=1795815 RepID=UPI003F550E1D